MDKEERERWNRYYNLVEGNPPRKTLIKALEKFSQEKVNGLAIDLGCGVGNDVLEMIVRGWSVLAIDKQPLGIKRLKERITVEQRHVLQTQINSFEQAILPPSKLINSSFALPFCHPNYFPKLWNKIETSLEVGGRFTGNLFGPLDEWANNNQMTFLSKSDVKTLFSNFEIEYFLEEDKDGKIATGDPKHWHLFHIVAKKVK